MRLRFTEEMFISSEPNISLTPYGMAVRAQAALDAHLATLPVVECQKLGESNLTDGHGPGWICAEASTRNQMPRFTTHQAVLFNVEKLKPKVCEHKSAQGDTLMGFQCANCDIDVKPIGWEPA